MKSKQILISLAVLLLSFFLVFPLVQAEIPQGSEFLVNNTTAGEQSTPSIGMDNNGNFVIAFKDGSHVRAQRYNSSGVEVGAEFQVNTTTATINAFNATDMNGNGDFVVVWDKLQNPNGQDIFGQLFDNTGTKVGSEFQVNSYTPQHQQRVDVGMDASGNFVVVWESNSQDAPGLGVYGQLYDNTGATVGSEFLINTTTVSNQGAPNVSMNAGGDFIVVWEGRGPGDTDGVFAQRYDNTGTKVGSEFRVNTTVANAQSRPAVALRSSGEFVITWESLGQDGDLEGVYAQRYDNTGTTVGGEFQVNTFTTSNQINPSIAIDNGGNFLISWTSNTQDGASLGIYAQEYNSSGVPLAGEFRVNTTTTDQQFGQEIGFDNSGNYAITWTSGNQDGDNFGVYAQRYTFPFVANSITPAQSALDVSQSSDVTVVFNYPLNTGTVTSSSFQVWGSQTGLIDGTFSFTTTVLSNDTAIFTPSNPFLAGERVQVVVTQSVTSSTGLVLSNAVQSHFIVEVTSGDTTFSSFQDLIPGSSPILHCLADFDGDAAVDIAVVPFANARIDVYLNSGTGTFTVPTPYAGTATGPYDPECADLNGDGAVDIAFTDNIGGKVGVILNNGNGTFGTASFFGTLSSPYLLKSADLDGDGDLDLVTSQNAADNVGVLLNNGSGDFSTFSNYSVASGSTNRGIAISDFTADGILDIIVLTTNTAGNEQIKLFSGNGDGTFGTVSLLLTISTDFGEYLIVADFDGDADSDIVAFHQQATDIDVFLNNGNNTFAPLTSYTPFPGGICIEPDVGDMDNDGDLDLVGSCGSAFIHIAINDGSGGFSSSVAQSINTSFSTGLQLADLNNDGSLDAVVTDGNGHKMVVALATPPDFPPQVTLLQPNGGELLTPGTFYDIIWTASDDSGFIDSHDLEYQVNPFFNVPGGAGLTTNNYQFSGKWGTSGSGDGQLNFPIGATIDSSGDVYVADTFNHRIQKLTSDGVFLGCIGGGVTGFQSPCTSFTSGSATSQFNFPAKVAVDGSGNIYVTDSSNHRIQKFDSSGNFLLTFGTFGTGDGQFSNPGGVLVDNSGNIYVSEGTGNRLQKFDSSPSFLLKWGSLGTGDGQFDNPSGLALDGSGNIYVADANNQRIQKFDSSGSFLLKFGSDGSGNGQFASGGGGNPRGVAVSAEGNILVPDRFNDRIQIFDSAGDYLFEFGSSGSGDGQFNQPMGVSLDSFGLLYVVDLFNNRLQKFLPGGLFSWLVPGDETTNGLIRATATDGAANSAQDVSDATFSIEEPVCVQPPSHLVSWWDGDSVSGTTASDIQDGNPGTLTNGATTATGRVGDAFSFNGTSSSVEIPYTSDLNPGTNDFTAELWVRVDSWTNAWTGFVMNYERDYSEYWWIGPYDTGVLDFRMESNGVVSGIQTSTGFIQLGTWYHIAGVRRGGDLELWINGQNIGTISFDTNVDVNPTYGTQIGGDQEGDSWGGHWWLDGLIDEVKIFDRALDISEIQSIYGAGTAGMCKGGEGRSRWSREQEMVEELESFEEPELGEGFEGTGGGVPREAAPGGVALEQEERLTALDKIRALIRLFAWMEPEKYQLLLSTEQVQEQFRMMFHLRATIEFLGEVLGYGNGYDYRDGEKLEIENVAELLKSIMIKFTGCFTENQLERALSHDYPENGWWWAGYWHILGALIQTPYEVWDPIDQYNMLWLLERLLTDFCPFSEDL